MATFSLNPYSELPDSFSFNPYSSLNDRIRSDFQAVKAGIGGSASLAESEHDGTYLGEGYNLDQLRTTEDEAPGLGLPGRYVQKAYNDSARIMPNDVSTFRNYEGTRNTASRYDGPTGDNFVERFQGSGQYDELSDAFQDTITSELSRDPYDTEERRAQEARRASTGARAESQIASRAQQRRLLSMGINPESGAYGSASRSAALHEAVTTTGAANAARENVRVAGLQDRDRRVQIASLGQQAAERGRELELAEYNSEQQQRQFGANLAMNAWSNYQQQRQSDANRGVQLWQTEMAVKSDDASRTQAERFEILDSLGALFGDITKIDDED